METKTKKKIKVAKFGGGIFRDPWSMPLIHTAIEYELVGADGLVAVVSAMGKTTRELLAKMPEEFVPKEKRDSREMDLLMSCGENEAAALLTTFLINKGIKAKSFTGQQAGFITDDKYGKAEIIDLQIGNLENFFYKNNDVAVVTGFQGVTRDGDITTLGFDGSDTTAAFAAYYLNETMDFEVPSCTFYKDVNGVYTLNPKNFPDEARLYKYLNYKEVLDGTAKGILHEKALKLFRDKESFPDVIVRNINLSQHEFTTICHRQTEFYR